MPLTRIKSGLFNDSTVTSSFITNKTVSTNKISDLSIGTGQITSNTIPLCTFATSTPNRSIYTDINGTPTTAVNFNHCINRVVYNYLGGNSDVNSQAGRYIATSNSTYNWVPGLYYDYTPLSSSSKLKFSCSWGTGWTGNSHQISHYIFFANNVDTCRYNDSGYYPESMNYFQFFVNSWGRFRSRIGMQYRDYSSNRYRLAVHSTYYWNGGGGNYFVRPQLVIEELSS